MKKLTFILVLLLAGASLLKAQKTTFTVAGPEDKYNQIRVVNETSQSDFSCRVFVLSGENDENKALYGVYNLKGHGDHDSNAKWLNRGEKVLVEVPADMAEDISIAVEYLDRPIFDIVIIHLTDAKAFDTVK